MNCRQERNEGESTNGQGTSVSVTMHLRSNQIFGMYDDNGWRDRRNEL